MRAAVVLRQTRTGARRPGPGIPERGSSRRRLGSSPRTAVLAKPTTPCDTRDVRSIQELLDVPDPAWPELAEALLERHPRTRILAIDRADGERCLHRLQVTLRSTLGALAFHTAGVTVDGGWLRLLGGGGHGLPSLADVNAIGDPAPNSSVPGLLLVAFDVLGGRFAVNGGALSADAGEVCYWAPDTLEWQGLEVGHTDFVHWSQTDRLDDFYADLRWDGWETEVAAVPLSHGLSMWPPLCAQESRPIGATSRRPVPWSELSAFLDKLAGVPTGRYRIEFES